MSIFSGRRDPIWPLAAGYAERLLAVWQALAPLSGRPPQPPPLGYRGCFVEDSGGGRRWETYAGAVRCGAALRSDPQRQFERLVINSAQPGILPANIAELAAL